MSDTYLYLPLVPECLVASMLPPEEFGSYLALGSDFNTRNQSLFFEIDPDFSSDRLPMQLIKDQCVTRPDGKPKNSVYLSIYRVLEHIPVSALGRLFLTTDDGKVLPLEKTDKEPESDRNLHLYQEFCPVHPCVASSLTPRDFCRFVTKPESGVKLPRVVFSELIIRELATDPQFGEVGELPYQHLNHLRHCLATILEDPEKTNKVVFRRLSHDFFFRTIRNGFFVGDQDDFAYYPMPSQDALNSEFYAWWRSAQVTHGL